jgi:hypothetical protein
MSGREICHAARETPRCQLTALFRLPPQRLIVMRERSNRSSCYSYPHLIHSPAPILWIKCLAARGKPNYCRRG